MKLDQRPLPVQYISANFGSVAMWRAFQYSVYEWDDRGAHRPCGWPSNWFYWNAFRIRRRPSGRLAQRNPRGQWCREIELIYPATYAANDQITCFALLCGVVICMPSHESTGQGLIPSLDSHRPAFSTCSLISFRLINRWALGKSEEAEFPYFFFWILGLHILTHQHDS